MMRLRIQDNNRLHIVTDAANVSVPLTGPTEPEIRKAVRDAMGLLPYIVATEVEVDEAVRELMWEVSGDPR